VVSAASSLPATVVTTAAIEKRLGLEQDWIRRRTGIDRRHRAQPDENLTMFAADAANGALIRAGVAPGDVDLVVVATMTPDLLTPHPASQVAGKLGTTQAGAIDIGGACSAFLVALTMTAGYIEAGRAETAVVVGADLMSRVLDHDDRVTAGIFGDGAGAVVVRAVPAPSRVGPTALGADGGDGDAILTPWPAGPVTMDGQRTFRRAIESLSACSVEAVGRAGLTLEEIDLFVPHQANGRITRAVGDELGLPTDRVVDCIDQYGNTTAGTLPIALAHAASQGRLEAGANVLLAAFGAGLAWGASTLRWGASDPEL